jgi:hypothetical protein
MTEHIVRVVHNRTTKYVLIDKALAESDTLSFAARGMMLYLLAKPDDWLVRMADLERASNGMGEQATRTVFAELEASGYVVRVRSRTKDGTWRYETTVYESPVEPVAEQSEDGPTVDGPTVCGSTGHGQVPHLPSTHLANTNPSSECLTPKKESDNEALPVLKKERSPEQRERDGIQTTVREYFERKTGLAQPAGTERKGVAALWWNPIREICTLVEWDTGAAMRLMDATLARLDGLTVSDPHSIVKTARALVAERSRKPARVADAHGMVRMPSAGRRES